MVEPNQVPTGKNVQQEQQFSILWRPSDFYKARNIRLGKKENPDKQPEILVIPLFPKILRISISSVVSMMGCVSNFYNFFSTYNCSDQADDGS